MEEYKEITIGSITREIEKIFLMPPERHIKVYTGPYGADEVSGAIEEKVTGKKRLYMGFKVARILRKAMKIYKSNYTGRYYKLIKKAP